jgi:hypothetical protein
MEDIGQSAVGFANRTDKSQLIISMTFTSRSISKLMRVKPGRTAHVRKTLTAAEIPSAVVYGDYDILAKIEVPGKLRLLGRRADVDSRNLGVLATLVKTVIRKGRAGVTETQTLLDFSDFVPSPGVEDMKLGEPSEVGEISAVSKEAIEPRVADEPVIKAHDGYCGA